MLIKYINTPQSCALEYWEQRDLERHPEKAEFYERLVLARTRRSTRKKKKEIKAKVGGL